LRLFAEQVWLDDGREVELPVLALTFDYGGVALRSSDPRRRFFLSQGGGVRPVDRDLTGESRAQCLLESFGAVEVDCLEHCAAEFDTKADYLLQPAGNVHSWCSFGAYALPQLRRLGWRIDIDPGYPYQVIDTQVPWFATVEPDGGERSDWFSLELGVEVSGRKVNLLPVLLDLFEQTSAGNLDSLLRMPARFHAVPVGDKYLPVPPEQLQRLLRVLLELYRGDSAANGSWELHGGQAASIAKLEEVFGQESAELSWRSDGGLRHRGRVLSQSGGRSKSLPSTGLRATLRPYQEEGVLWLQHLRENGSGGVLADDMGLGKTLQTIAHLTIEKEAGRMDRPTLVVLPTSLIGNWQRELAKFAPHVKVCVLHGPKRHARRGEMLTADVVLTTYPLLVRDLEAFRATEYHYVILDEAQAIKNRRSLAHRAVSSLEARYRLCLTGTPVENHLEELWSLFDFMMPGLLGDAQRFRDRFRVPIERDGNESQLQALRARVAPYILRRMKEHVARDLPPKTELVRPVELDGEQRELYESIRLAAHADVRHAIKKNGLTASTVTILDALMKLRQVCCDPRLVSVPSARGVMRSAKYELLMELCTKQLEQGRRLLIFSQFTRMLALIAAGLEERQLRYVQLTGGTGDRQKPIDAFERGDVDVFLISLKAGGTGLNLTSADTVIHYDPWWNPAAQAQATDRAYRIGQTRPVFVYNLIVAGSVEERMLGLQQRKQHLANTILGGAAKAGATFSDEELEDLFAPLDD
jgi:superfamily II DNA or RNA helicase